MKTPLVLMLEKLLEDDFNSIRGIFDYLIDENNNIAFYKYRQLYSAFGLLLERLKEHTIPEIKSGRIINITKEQIYNDNINLIAPANVNVNTMVVSEFQHNMILRAVMRFKNRIQEIFWEDLQPLEMCIPLIESKVKYAQECRTKQSSSESGLQGIPEPYTEEYHNSDPINDPIDNN